MCVLRASGSKFDVDRFLRDSNLKPCGIYYKGKPRNWTNPSGQKNKFSGFNVGVSDASWSGIQAQVIDAIQFLRRNRAEIKRLAKRPGLTQLVLDFPVDQRVGMGIWVQCDSFPPTLVKEAGKLGVGLELSIYEGKSVDGRVEKRKRKKRARE